MYLNKTLLEIFEKLKDTQYKDIYEINIPDSCDELSEDFKSFGLRLNVSGFIFFYKKILLPIYGELVKIPEEKLANFEGFLISSVLAGLGRSMEKLAEEKETPCFDIEKMSIYLELFSSDFKTYVEEANQRISKNSEIFNDWKNWLVNEYQSEKESEEKLISFASNFQEVIIKNTDNISLDEVKNAGKPFGDFVKTKEGQKAFFKNELDNIGLPNKTEVLYFSLINTIVLIDIIFSCRQSLE